MIDRNWFALEKCKIVKNEYKEDDKTELNVACGNRNFQVFINECHSYFENQDNPIRINTDVFLLEEGVHIASYVYNVLHSAENNIPIEKIKFIFQEWLLEKTELEELQLKVPELKITEVYEYYLKGKEGLEEYEIVEFRRYLNPYNTDNQQTLAVVELFDVYLKSEILKPLFRYPSLGRLCFSLSKDLQFDFHCVYFYNRRYVVSNYENTTKYYFDSAEETIAFLENRFQNL